MSKIHIWIFFLQRLQFLLILIYCFDFVICDWGRLIFVFFLDPFKNCFFEGIIWGALLIWVLILVFFIWIFSLFLLTCNILLLLCNVIRLTWFLIFLIVTLLWLLLSLIEVLSERWHMKVFAQSGGPLSHIWLIDAITDTFLVRCLNDVVHPCEIRLNLND